MKMKLTESDRKCGPLTFGRSGWRAFGLWLEDSLTAYAFGWAARLATPRPLRFVGRYGVLVADGHFNVYYGRQSWDSSTDKRWGCFLPWTQWRFVRYSINGLRGEHVWTEPRNADYASRQAAIDACPTVSFEIIDFDGARIIAKTRIEEREWHFGTSWCKWLSWFRKPLIRRSLDIAFSAEVGKAKGSWKGGMVGHGIDMLPGELHEDAFRRYCAKELDSREGKYRIAFVGRVDASPANAGKEE